jgi:hypothetical protein
MTAERHATQGGAFLDEFRAAGFGKSTTPRRSRNARINSPHVLAVECRLGNVVPDRSTGMNDHMI